ncbi:phosphatidylserine decarboxylase 1 [Balamuthia mandrillaris]
MGLLVILTLAILAIILPPLPVALVTGLSMHLLINILLTLLGWLPGVLHAFYVIHTRGWRFKGH